MLRALYQAGAEGISGNSLAGKTGAEQASIRDRIQEWRRVGFQIEASPHFGYRLLETPHRLLGEDVAARLGPVKTTGRQIQVFQETSSTNEVALRLAGDGVAEGAVVFAEHQSRGRGRLGRAWFGSAGKSVLMSLLLRPALRPPEAARLTILGAAATARAIEKLTTVRTSIKWPNDVIVGEEKLAGILTEMRAEPDRIHHLVLGIGLNVNQTKTDFPEELRQRCCSLQILTGQMWNRAAVAAALLKELDWDYQRMKEGRFARVAAEWQNRCATLGREVAVQYGKSTIHGRAEAIDGDGALLLRTGSGLVKRILGGDVLLCRSKNGGNIFRKPS